MFSSHKKKSSSAHTFGQLKEQTYFFGDIRKYFDRKDTPSGYQRINENTAEDLDFEELFMFLDRTETRVGQQFLYSLLREIPLKVKDSQKQEKLIQLLRTDEKLREKLASSLEQLTSKEAYNICDLFQEKHLQKPKWFIIIPFLSVLSITSLIGQFFIPQLFFLFIMVLTANMMFHYWNKRNLTLYNSGIVSVLRMYNSTKLLFKIKELKSFTESESRSLKIIARLRTRLKYFQVEAKVENDQTMVFWGMLELIKVIFLMEPILLFNGLKRLEKHKDAVEGLYRLIGEVDSLISIASLRAGSEHCLPEFIAENKLEAEALYHPLIFQAIANDLQLENKSMLLTGSNMSGKTSFIRTIGINALTAQTLRTCFAQSYKTPVLKIQSAIRISDDLLNEKSYYFEEVLRIKEMIEESEQEEKCLFLLDELYKGTNTRERIAAADAVLSFLAGNNNLIFAATHDIELADMLLEKYELYHFSESIKQEKVNFDYKLKKGKLTKTNAIRILELNGYPEEVIKKAIENLSK